MRAASGRIEEGVLEAPQLPPLPDGSPAMARRLRVAVATAAVAILSFALLDHVIHPPHL